MGEHLFQLYSLLLIQHKCSNYSQIPSSQRFQPSYEPPLIQDCLQRIPINMKFFVLNFDTKEPNITQSIGVSLNLNMTIYMGAYFICLLSRIPTMHFK